jgi:hypothetical protein
MTWRPWLGCSPANGGEKEEMDMDRLDLVSVAGLLMRQIEVVLEAGVLPENAQIVVRPIFTWPDGQPAIWVMLNSPN